MSVKIQKSEIPLYFTLYNFEKVFNREKDNHREVLKGLNLDNKIIAKQLDEYNFPISRKYVLDNVFILNNGSWCVRIDEKDGYEILDDKTFNAVYGKTINEFNSGLLRRVTKRYAAEVYLADFRIEAGKEEELGKINLARKMKYSFDSKVEKLSKTEKKLFDMFIEDFTKAVICNGNETNFDFLVRLISSCLHYMRSNKITILSGLGGTGKTTFMDFLHELLGEAFQIPQHSVVTGEDKFNLQLQGAVVCYIEETSGKGETSYAEMFKKMKENCTSENINIRPMRGNPYDVKNLLNYFISTNYTADIVFDRRMFSLEVSNARMNDTEFFGEIRKAISNKKIMQHLFNYFYAFDHKKIAGENAPQSELMKDKQLIETDIDRFLLQSFVFEENKLSSMTLSDLFLEYNEWRGRTSKKQIDTNGKSSFNSHMRNILTVAGVNKDKTKLYSVSTEAIYAFYNRVKKWSEKDIAEKKSEYDVKCGKKEPNPILFFDIETKEVALQKQVDKLKAEKAEMMKRIEELEKLVKTEKVVENEEKPKEKQAKKDKKNKFDNYDHDEFLSKITQ